MGPEATDKKSVRLLNRIVEWTPEGINMERDQRHAEIIISQLGVIDMKPLSSPGERIKPKELTEEDVQELTSADATKFRAVVA